MALQRRRKPKHPIPVRTGDRIEEYQAVTADGETVTVVHNIETGETRVK